jgi:hypothetical protein
MLVGSAVGLIACGQRGEAQTDMQVQEMMREVIPQVERAARLPFKAEPVVAVRSRDQVRAYLTAKLAAELPDEEFERRTLAYRLFGMIPDSLDLRALLEELYTEQVIGYYDPDSTTLYVVDGAASAELRFTLAHELVHALQDQYMALDTLLSPDRQNDRRVAAQAVLEGQATLASVLALLPGEDLNERLRAIGDFWGDFRRDLHAQQERMPVFTSAPLVIREGLVFPYLAGADFVRWFMDGYPDTVPYGARLPASTEHILHPERYRMGDAPLELAFPEGLDAVYGDVLGEFETRILLTELTQSESMATAGAAGWGGDRYVVLRAGSDYVLVWWTVWDSERAAKRFTNVLSRGLAKRKPTTRTQRMERATVGGQPGVRYVDAPAGWTGWDRVPTVSIP